MKSWCIAVPRKKAEEIRKALLEIGLFRKNLAIARDENFIFFPILEAENNVLGFEVFEREFRRLEERTRDYKDMVNVPEKLHSLLPSSFDMVGKIAIIKLPDELSPHKKAVGEAILKANKSIETVALDLGVEGGERVRKLEIVEGEQNLNTIHKEYGIELEIDPSKVYFSPRLATEHWRVAQMVKEGEVVLDMFCGVGPFAILIAKHRKPSKVYAMDINEYAIQYLRRNIERNKVSNVHALHGDSKALVSDLESTDRIIMNLPFSSFEFLPEALSNVENGGVIHYYEVISRDKKDNRFEDIQGVANGKGIELIKQFERPVHTYSPDSDLYCFDLKVKRGKGDV